MNKKEIIKYSVVYICFMLFIICVVCVPGKSFVHSGDGYTQYWPTYLYTGEWIRNFLETGNLRFFDFSIGYGENIIGTLNYYGLGDPINVLSCLAQGKYAYYLFAVGIFLRLYLAGFGMLLYLNHKGLCGNMAIACSFIYTFSVFSIVQGLWFYSFLNAQYLFPYLALVLEKIIEGNKGIKYRISFTILIGIQACCGFYFLYMQVCLLVVFAVIHYLDIYREKPMIICNIKKTIELCLFGTLGILLAGFFLFPSLEAFFCSSRTAGDNDLLRLMFSADEIIGLFREMVIPNTDAEKNSLGIPLIGLLAICMVFSKKYEKTELKWITIVFGIMYLCPFVWSVLNGMSYESNRWVYALYFVLSYIVCKTFTEVKSVENKYIIPFVLLAGSSIVLHYMEYGAKIRSAVYLLLVIGIIILLVKKVHSSMIWALVTLGCVGINVVFMFSSWRISGFNLAEKFVDLQEIRQLSADNQEYRGELVRENIYKNGYEVMLNQKNGTAEYLSMLNGNVFDFYSSMYLSTGIHGSRHDLRGPDARKNMLTLLNIKEFVSNDKIIENELFVRQGLLYTDAMSEEDFMRLSPMERQTAIMKYIVLEDNTLEAYYEIMEPKEIAFETLSPHDVNNDNQMIHMAAGETIELKLNSGIDNEGVYALISNFVCYQNDFEVVDINGEELIVINPTSKYDTGTYDYLIYLPSSIQGEVNITFMASGDYSWNNIQLYKADGKYLKAAIADLSMHLADTYVDNDAYLSTWVMTERPGYYFYSIPYSKNWIAFLDGNKTEVLKANIGFMAVEVPEGKHTIELKYCPIWVYAGGVCTVFAIVILLLLGFWRETD